MTNLRTAAQQALEALERLQNAIYNIGGEHVTGLHVANDAADSAEKPMGALRATLAQQAEHFCDTHCTWADHAPGCVRAEPVQEPYCYVYEYDGVFGLHREFYPLPYNGMKPSRTVPVYTTPPRQKPLTQEEIPALAEQVLKPSIYYDAAALLGTDGLVALVRAVERAHGIKE